MSGSFLKIKVVFPYLMLDINDTDAEDYDDFEIIVTGTMADIVEGEDYTFWGGTGSSSEIWPTVANDSL